MRFTSTHRTSMIPALLAGLLLLLWPGAAPAAPIGNTATGSTDGVPSSATVTLDRVGGVATQVLAEIAPNELQAGSTSNALVYHLLPTIEPGDSGIERVEITAPAGYSNATVSSVSVGGTTLAPSCPVPGPGQFCATTAGGVMTVLLGQRVATTQTEIRVDCIADAPPVPGSGDFTSVVADGAVSMPTLSGDADLDPSDANSLTVDVIQTQGLVLQLLKSANKQEALVGDVVTYAVIIQNTAAFDVLQVTLEDTIPANFKYVDGSARLDGAPIPDPIGNRPLIFDIGTVPALVDTNGNGVADPGEPGYRVLAYQLVVGSGAIPGKYPNTVVAKDFCDTCVISNVSGVAIDVTVDPLFDLGLIIGKVYEDRNRNEWQDPGERGVPGAMVALDDGTYALTDEHGRFHFPAAKPGQRMLKLNLLSLPGASAATDPSRIVWITPGLMVRVNFGVLLERNVESIGRPSLPGLQVTGVSSGLPLELVGDPETMSLLINGERFELPTGDVRLGLSRLEESIQLDADEPKRSVSFRVDLPQAAIEEWRLVILDAAGEPFRMLEGNGSPPEPLPWDGTADDGRRIEAGEVYRYQLSLTYVDGSESESPFRPFGVNRTKVLTLSCIARAFAFDSAVLTADARIALARAAVVLREMPGEVVVLEGHTDSKGPEAYNLRLSRRRAAAVLDYFVEVEKLAAERFVLQWFGESRPSETNATAEGRAHNRRVEVAAEVEQVVQPEIGPLPTLTPSVRIDGDPVPRSGDGRYAAQRFLEQDTPRSLEVEVRSAEGRSARVTITIPRIEITAPRGTILLGPGSSANGCSNGEATPSAVTCRIEGRTEPGNRVELEGEPLEVGPDGLFATDWPLADGQSSLRFLARNPQGFTQLVRLDVEVSDRDAEGRRVLVSEPVPTLTVQLPPEGLKLPSVQLVLYGVTDVDNQVQVNGKSAEVGPDGGFRSVVTLPTGASRLVVQATDPQGRVGTIERDVVAPRHELFLLAFADGKLSKLEADGFVEGSGLEQDDDYYVDGRVAFYLKGRIAGKYLITSALDTGKNEMEHLFRNVDLDQSDLLLRNLDPDKLYPIYGDSSTVVFDAQSRGKFYLALESETLHALVGNYPLALTDTELAAYQRTLYGARLAYRSAARTKYGEADTQVVVFGADVEQAHTRDELRATGGSLYYLSQRELIEGSEQVVLVVRDEITGLVLSRQTQRQNVDYTIKYEEGRLMFHRPISSVAASETLLGDNTLKGNPVFIQVDYEARVDSFEKTAAGGRVRQQIGDHFAVGGTYVEDELQSGPYELQGLDAELRLGQGTRLTAEYAESSGNDSLTFFSNDGGLTYTPAPAVAGMAGSAWKAAAELDVGEWFGSPDRYRVGVYYKKLDAGFISSGNLLEQGSERSGVHGNFVVTARDTILFRYDRDDRTLPPAAPASTPETTSIGSLEWKHKQNSWGFDLQYFDKDSDGASGNALQRSSLAGVRLWKKFGEKLHLRLERQQTLSGRTNDQTRVGADYQLLPSVALTLEATDGSLGESMRAGAIVKVGEGELYLTERVVQDEAGQQSSTILGARSPLGQSGKVYTEYQHESAESGSRVISLVGLQQQWDPAPGFRFVLSAESADVSSATGTTERTSVATSLSYSDPDRLTIVSRNEWRFEDGAADRTQYFSFNQLDYALNPDFSLLARYRYSKTEDKDTNTPEARFDERVLGLAFRPVDHDRFNSIAKYTRLFDMPPMSSTGLQDGERTQEVISVESALRISHRVEWLAKVAFRRQEERVPGMSDVETSTYLTIQHFNITLFDPIDLGLEYRIRGQREADDQQRGWLGEVSWRLRRHFRFGVGYNFTDFSDNEFSQNDYSVRGWFIRAQGKY